MRMYWVIKNEIGGSHIPYTLDELKEWKSQGVKRVLVLPEEWEIEEVWGSAEYYFSLLREMGFDYLHVPVPDNYPPTEEQMEEIYRWLNRGKGNLVHCVGGIGRTGTVISAYLILKLGLDAQEAVEEVRRYRPNAVQSLQQFQFLLRLSERKWTTL